MGYIDVPPGNPKFKFLDKVKFSKKSFYAGNVGQIVGFKEDYNYFEDSTSCAFTIRIEVEWPAGEYDECGTREIFIVTETEDLLSMMEDE